MPSPIAILEAAHAVHSDSSGPRVPSSIETQPAARFGMIWTIENGFTLSGPRLLSWSTHASNEREASDAGRNGRADPFRDRSHVEAGVGLGLARSRQREVGEPVHSARRLVVDVLRHLEILHLTGKCRGSPSSRTA